LPAPEAELSSSKARREFLMKKRLKVLHEKLKIKKKKEDSHAVRWAKKGGTEGRENTQEGNNMRAREDELNFAGKS
jgi:hypothetical protein